MKVTDFTRSALAYRRQKRELLKRGFHPPIDIRDIMRSSNLMDESIVEVVVAVGGKGVYVRTAREELK